jgi:hypothetical protein
MDMLLVTPEEKKKIHEYYNVDEKRRHRTDQDVEREVTSPARHVNR